MTDDIKALEAVVARVVRPLDKRLAALQQRVTALEQRRAHRLLRWVRTLFTRRAAS